MNRRWRQAAALAVLLGGPAAFVSAADLPATVRTSSSADQQKSAIDTYVKAQIAKIASHDKTSSTAREEVCRQPETNGPVTPSASFQSTYVTSVVANLDPLLKDKSDKPEAVVIRLNAAIIVSRLANATRQPQLLPLVEQMMADPSAAVSLWGLKGAGALLPDAVRLEFNRKRQTLTPAIVKAAISHPAAGAVTQTAYDVLYLPDPPAGQTPLEAAAYGPSIDAMGELFSWRIKQYVQSIPPSPQADRLPPVFFVRGNVNGVMTAQQRITVVQNLLDLLNMATQYTAKLPAGEDRTQVIELIKSCSGSLYVLFQQQQPAVAQQFQAIARVHDPVQTQALLTSVNNALAAVKALPAYKTLKDAPTVQ